MQDPSREYYEPFELRVFENIECEWPLFFCLSMLDFLFQGDKEAVEEYSEALEEVFIGFTFIHNQLISYVMVRLVDYYLFHYQWFDEES